MKIEEGEQRPLIDRLQAELGGEVTSIRRQARWRPAWFVDLRRNGEVVELYVRGERTDMLPIFPLAHECKMQEELERSGIPVPHVHGYLTDPPMIIMDRVSGMTEFDSSSEAQRRSVMDDYVQILARMHHLDVEPFVAAGAEMPGEVSDVASTGIRAYERAFRRGKVRPDAFMEFCLGWLKRHPPSHRVRPSLVVWDSGQFLHRDGRIAALIDLELAHIGDPMMDLAGLRMRSSVIDYGDLGDLYRRYEELTGDEVDLRAIELYHFAFAITTQLALHRALVDPTPESDLMNYLQWCSESNLYAVEALATLVGVELEEVKVPAPQSSPVSVAHRHLVETIRSMEGDDELSTYRLRTAFRLARHLRRFDEIGPLLTECDIDDVAALVGRRPSQWEESERQLEAFVLETDAGCDAELIRLFHRRLQRQRALLGPEGSPIARHIRIQPIRSPSP